MRGRFHQTGDRRVEGTEGRIIAGQWNGREFVPTDPDGRDWCRHNLRIWEKVSLTVAQARSEKTHRHHFAWLHDAWMSLPEEYQGQWWAASSEHLRKYALIKTGFFDCQMIAVDSAEEAMRWAMILRGFDSYCVLIPKNTVLMCLTAKSQKMSVMGKDQFQRSKTAVLNFVADLLGIYPEELVRVNRKKKEKTDDLGQ